MRTKLLISPLLVMLAAKMVFAQAPTITSFSPATGPVGTLILVNGANLGNPTAFTIGGVTAIVTSNNGSQLQALVMPGSATGAISITTAGGSVNSSTNFTITSTPYPQTQQGPELQGPAPIGAEAYEGAAIAISADGNTAVIGAPDMYNTGAAFIYIRSGGVWSQQGPTLTEPRDPQAAVTDEEFVFGAAVAISADGNTALISDPVYPNENTGQGAVYVFTRSGGVWSSSVTILGTLLGYSTITSSHAGGAVAISADAHTILVGEVGDNYNSNDGNADGTYNQGGIAAYQLNGNTLTFEGVLLGTGGDPGVIGQGTMLALSADGKTFVETGQSSSAVKETAWVFSWNGSAWQQQGSPLVAAEATANTRDYWPVAISADGNNFIVGDPNFNNYAGSAWVFTRSGGIWSEQTQLLASGITGQTEFGNAVAISADGNTALAGAPASYNYNGSTLAFTRSGATWSQAAVLRGSPATQPQYDQTYNQGYRLEMSPDGATAIIGAPVYTQGNFYIFVANASTASQTQTLTFAPLSQVNYGAADFAPGATSTNSTIPISYSSSNAQVATITAAGNIHTTGAGTTTITATQAGNATYVAATPIPQSLTVNAVPLTITADNVTKITGMPNPTLTASYSGFVNGDGSGNLSQQPMLTTTAITTSPPGSYPISVSGAAGAGYIISYVAGTLTVTASNNDNLSGLKLSNGVLTPAFNTATGSYSASVQNSISSITITPTTSDPGATVTINNLAATSGSVFGPIALATGLNTIDVTVKAADGVTTRTYSISVTRQVSANAYLSGLKLNPGLKVPVFASTVTSYTATVANGVTATTVTPVTSDANAPVTVDGAPVVSGAASTPIPLVVGPNVITIRVVAQNGFTTEIYTVTVTREPDMNDLLSGLKLSAGTKSPIFMSSVTSYTANVVNGVTSITVIATTADPGATLLLNGTTALGSGAQSAAIALAVGDNTITVQVTAQDGVTTQTYTVVVTRAAGVADSFNPGISVSAGVQNFEPLTSVDGIQVHQAVSPNGDGVNDFLQIDNINLYPDNKLTIMNRNGQLIYEAIGYDNSSKVFDGHSSKNGQMQLPGTYFYQLDYTENGITKHKTGFLVLKY